MGLNETVLFYYDVWSKQPVWIKYLYILEAIYSISNIQAYA